MDKPIIILSGPTASGKSALGMFIAKKKGAVIINCDSKQLYCEIPVITAQPTQEEQQEVPHRLYGAISVAEYCSVARWLEMAKGEIDKCHSKGKIPLLIGGTGMYIKSLTEGLAQIPDIEDATRNKVRALIKDKGSEAVHALLDEQMKAKLKAGDSQRVARAYEVLLQTGKSLAHWQQQKTESPYKDKQCLKFFLNLPREKVYENCNNRFVKMLDAGALEEAKLVASMNLDESLPAMRAHGMPELIAYIKGNISKDKAIEQSQTNTRHYIKRQYTWFRHQMKDTISLEENYSDKMLEQVNRFLLTIR